MFIPRIHEGYTRMLFSDVRIGNPFIKRSKTFVYIYLPSALRLTLERAG